MTIPCEIAVKSVIPAVKALITQELLEKHGLKQEEVAKILGISQSAVSKYTRKTRGQAIHIEQMEEIQIPINNIVTLILDGGNSRTEFLKLFCEICEIIREEGLMCEFCQKTNPTIRMEECDFCDGKYIPKKRR